MSEGQSQRSVALSAQHRQEAEVATAEECERAAAETAATAARAARLAMVKLVAARAEVEVAAAADAAHAAAVTEWDEPQPLSGPITIDEKLHLTREEWEAYQGDGKKE
jgi:hypothetical protein